MNQQSCFLDEQIMNHHFSLSISAYIVLHKRAGCTISFSGIIPVGHSLPDFGASSPDNKVSFLRERHSIDQHPILLSTLLCYD